MRARTSATAAAAVVALCAAGCGGARHGAAAAQPRLPRALAQTWAQQADRIAAALAAGDGCAAETQATALRAQIVQAAGERRIAQRLVAPLVGAVNDLPNRIVCTPPARPPKRGHGHEHKPGKPGKGGD